MSQQHENPPIFTPFDYGFENSPVQMAPNFYNIGGIKCKNCKISDTCILKTKDYESLCFERMHRNIV